MLTDIEIAQATKPLHISEIARRAGVPESYLEQYGSYKAKVDYNLLRDEQHRDADGGRKADDHNAAGQ